MGGPAVGTWYTVPIGVVGVPVVVLVVRVVPGFFAFIEGGVGKAPTVDNAGTRGVNVVVKV